MKVMQYRDFSAAANNSMFGGKSKNPISWFDGSMTADEQVLVQLGRFQTKYSYNENGELMGYIHDQYDFQTKLDESAKQITKASTGEDLKVVAEETFKHAKEGNVLKTVQTLATLTGKPFNFDLNINLGKENAALYKVSQDRQKEVKKWLAEHKQVDAGPKNNPEEFLGLFRGYVDEKSGLDTSKESQTIYQSKLANDLRNYLETKKGLTKKQIYLIDYTDIGIHTIASLGDPFETTNIVQKAAGIIIAKGVENCLEEYYNELQKFKESCDNDIASGMTPKEFKAKIFNY
jgi:hypothetical protein